jgi:hypothetical protein
VEDNTPPTISCPADKTIDCTVTPVFGTPTCSDDCGNCQIVQVGADQRVDGDCPQEYTLTRTWKAVDECGNESAPCSQTITVEDNTPPTISCPADQTIDCTQEPVFGTPTCSDDCGQCTVVEVSDVTTPGACPQEFSRTKTWKAVDDCGNESSTCSQTITVEDNTPPIVACPDPIEVCDGDPIEFTPPGAEDDCDPNPTVVCTRSDGLPLNDPYPIGVTTITCTATDACGNSSTCTTTVTVNPNPSCVMDPFDPLTPGVLTGTISGGTPPYASCSATVIGVGWSADSCVLGGINNEDITVNYSVVQLAALSASFTVTVIDDEGCESTCELDVTIVEDCDVVPAAQEICEGGSATFCAIPTAGSPPFQVSWQGPSGPVPGNNCANVPLLDQNCCITVSEAGIYTATTTDALGFVSTCEGVLVVNPNPECTITKTPETGRTCVGFETELCATPGMASYLWSGPEQNGSTDQCITVTTAGTYTVAIVDENGCESDCSITLEECVPCRMTGGSNDGQIPPKGYAEGDGGSANAQRWTNGGQVGAPTLESPGPFGEWTHREHGKDVSSFTFHAGTHSAPEETFIETVQCFDLCNCDPARPAPAKQIDFNGIGAIKNGSLDGNGKGTLMSFYVHIEDLGEPGNQALTNADDNLTCPDMGQDGNPADCDCADFYHIRIWDNLTMAGAPVYEAYGYIHGGNFQIHPAVGETFDGSGCP